MSINEKVANVLLEAMEQIDREDYGSFVSSLNRMMSEHPEAVDARMIAEYKMIERLVQYKKEQTEWYDLKATRLIYEYLEDTYAKDLPEFAVGKGLPDADVIWCCWFQGLEQAPEVVKKCIASLERFGKEVRILTADNFSEYVTMPESMVQKWKEGVINNTHFSDLLRIELLAERGGLWIDATVFCSDATDILSVLEGTDLFAYSFVMRVDPTKHILFDSWFLYAPKSNILIQETREMLRRYWENEDGLLHYFLFHLCFSNCCRRHLDAWAEIPVYSMEPCHVLQQEMLGPYSEKRWRQIMKMSGIHKLTYKYDTDTDVTGSMLEHLLRS